MWHLVMTFWVLVSIFPKYVNLAKLTMVQIVGNMEDERCFSILAFIKSKFHNRLITHLPFVMFAQQFIYYVKFHVCRLHWVMVRSSSSILLWWIGNTYFVRLFYQFCKSKRCVDYIIYLLNWMIILHAIQLFLHDVGIFYPLCTIQCQWFIFAFVVTLYYFVVL